MTSSRSCPFLHTHEHSVVSTRVSTRLRPANALRVGSAGLDQRGARAVRLRGRSGVRCAQRRSAQRGADRVGGWQRACARAMMGHQPKPGSAPMPPCCLPLPSHFMLPLATPHLGQEPAAAGGGVAAGCAPARVSACSGATSDNAELWRTVAGAAPSGPAAAATRSAAPREHCARLTRGAARLGAKPQSASDAMLSSEQPHTRAEHGRLAGEARLRVASVVASGALATPLRERSQRTHRRCALAEASCPAAHSRAQSGAEAEAVRRDA